jgi:dynein heavy chain
MHKAMKKMNLQPKEEFVGKSLQLYDMIKIRHGLMMVGQAFAGKTKAVQVLKEAMTSIYNDALAEGKDPKPFLKVQQKTVNPKSIKKN